jgi:hypothetical protein
MPIAAQAPPVTRTLSPIGDDRRDTAEFASGVCVGAGKDSGGPCGAAFRPLAKPEKGGER